MKIYIAARFESQAEMRVWREKIQALGHEVTSRWLDVKEPYPPAETCAVVDLVDVRRADLVVCFSPRSGFYSGRGGRHVEFGYALAMGLPVLLVGEPENVFHWLVPCCAETDLLALIEGAQEMADARWPQALFDRETEAVK